MMKNQQVEGITQKKDIYFIMMKNQQGIIQGIIDRLRRLEAKWLQNLYPFKGDTVSLPIVIFHRRRTEPSARCVFRGGHF